jgi:hypothetical protein
MAIVERRAEKIVAAVQPQLEPGEQVQATLGFAQTGPSPWFYALTYLIIFWIKVLGIVVTDKRVFFVKRSVMTNRVKSVDHVVPRDQVRVVEWSDKALWSKLRLQEPNGELKLNVHRIHRAEAEQIVAALSGQVTQQTA